MATNILTTNVEKVCWEEASQLYTVVFYDGSRCRIPKKEFEKLAFSTKRHLLGLLVSGEPPMADTQDRDTTKYKLAVKFVTQVLKGNKKRGWGTMSPMSTSELRRKVKSEMVSTADISSTNIHDVMEDFQHTLHWMSGRSMITRIDPTNRSQYYWCYGKRTLPEWEATDIDPGQYTEENGDSTDFPAITADDVKKDMDSYKKSDLEEEMDRHDARSWKAEVDKLREKVRVLEKTMIDMEETIKDLNKARKVEFTIVENGKPTKIKETVHEIFPEVLFQIKMGYFPMLVGPSGCGKTELAIQMAKHLKLEFGMQSFSGGVTEAKLYGRSTPNIGKGTQEYNPTQFVIFYGRKEGGLFLLDECDAGDPNVLLSMNGPLSNGVMTVDRKVNPVINMSKNFVCIAAANTWGAGADRQYVGRNQLDLAFTKRFVLIEMDYDKNLEFQLCPGKKDYVDRMHKYRDAMRNNRIERVLDTRFIIRGYQWLKHGKDDDYVDSKLFLGWREDEIRKVKGY